jgi:mannose-6-phosphate isomerase-like protein (cupin superfamily)
MEGRPDVLDGVAGNRFDARMDTITWTTTPDEFLVMQDLVRLHLPYQQTDGDFFVMEVEVAAGGGVPPLHTHPAAEFFYTLEGELTYFRLDGDELVEFSGGPGTCAFIPGGVPHTYRNFSGAPARYLATLAPPVEMQDFLVAAGIREGEAPRTPEQVLAIGERFGLVTLDIVPERRG